MKHERPLINRLSSHILVLVILVLLVVGLPLESCSESYNYIIPNPKIAKGSKVKPTIQQSSVSTEGPKDTYLHTDKQLASYSNELFSDKIQESQVQEKIIVPDQNAVSVLMTPPIEPAKSFIEKEDDKSNAVIPTSKEEQQLQPRVFTSQSSTFQSAKQVADKQREVEKRALQEKEAQLINKIFRTAQGYIVKFYKETGVWKAEVTEEIGSLSRKFELIAYLGKGEDLIRNIDWLLNVNEFRKTSTDLIQVVLPNISNAQKGYVYVGGVRGGSQRKIKQIIVSSESEEEEDRGEEEKENPILTELKEVLNILENKPNNKSAKTKLLNFRWEEYKEYLDSQEDTEQVRGLLNQAIAWYEKLARSNNATAANVLIKLRELDLYIPNLDQEAISWYKQAVEEAIQGTKLTFEQFQRRAKHQFERAIQEVERKRRKRTTSGREPTWQGPMRISDLIVMELNTNKAPGEIAWGGNYNSFQEANADIIFGPLFKFPNTRKYEDAVMAIDPSGKGADETAYCVAKRCGNYYYIMEVGGMAGRYSKEEDKQEEALSKESSKSSLGNSPEVLEKLILVAQKHGVSRVIVENNNDKSFAKLLEKQMLELQSSKNLKFRVIKFDSVHQGKNKEQRILKTLRPLLIEHHLVIDRTTLEEDFKSEPKDNLYYKFFYQLMSVVKNKIYSASYFDGCKPWHDDRVDAVADAIRYLQERKNKLDNITEGLTELKARASKGGSDAQLELARRYKDGIGTPEDYEQAIEWYKMIIDNKKIKGQDKHTQALFNLAQLYQIMWQQAEIEKEKQQESREKGKEKKKDATYTLEQVVELYEKAVTKGHIDAIYELGKLHKKGLIQEKGKGDKKREKSKTDSSNYKAISMFEQAANAGHVKAAYKLGKIYQNGLLEIKQNPIKAAKYYTMAADRGNIEAKLNLANMYYDGRGIAQDYKKAKKYYIDSAEFGYLKAQVRLAHMYYNAEGGSKNYTKAFRWYQEAANRGVKEAQYILGKMYENALGIKENNLEQALHWYMVAADQEDVNAQFEVGKMYENTENYTDAYVWYEKAANQGHTEACFKLGEFLRGEKLAVMNKNEVTMVRWYKKAANQGHENARLRLSSMYALGKGVEKNEAEALKYYESENVSENKSLKAVVKSEPLGS
jgi:TPR repeat protein